MQNVNNVSFGSNYFIPVNQVKDSKTMREIGMESSKFIKTIDDIARVDNGIVVKVDDARDKEYEATIAKYGINIQKYTGKFPENASLDLRSYSYMANTLHPEKASKMIEAYKNFDEKQKDKAFLDLYREFKNSNYSVENKTTKLIPANDKIVKYKTKNGVEIMTREVKLENGYTFMAVADVKNPSKTMLINKEEFEKFIKEYAVQK